MNLSNLHPVIKDALSGFVVSDEWNEGDQFTTPETGQIIFTVKKVTEHDVIANDARSRSGETYFAKSYITKGLGTKKTQTEIEMDKYDTLPKIIEQLEFCNYESEGGYLKNNVAFLSLKRMANR